MRRAGKILLLLAAGGTILQTASSCQITQIALISNVLSAWLLQGLLLGGIAT